MLKYCSSYLQPSFSRGTQPNKIFKRSKYAPTENQLIRSLKKLFRNTKFVLKSASNSKLVEDLPLELDIYLPEEKIAFKFHDKYFYFEHFYLPKKKEQSLLKYSDERLLAKAKGITLIHVPFWWDGTGNSLIATIREERSDLLKHLEKWQGKPIPQEPPEELIDKKRLIPGYGELTQATFYTDTTDPTNWYLFEKYDGIRAFWNPDEKQFYSRFGNILRVHQSVVDSMPSIYLDGELWFGRNNLIESMKISQKVDVRAISWDKFKYMVFDYPTEKDKTFKERYEILEQMLPRDHPYVKLAEKVVCTGRDHVEKFVDSIISQGGEGIILRNPDALYKSGKSSDYIKFKTFRDAEARIVNQVSPTSWNCELPNGLIFESSADQELLKQGELNPGDIVSFKYTKISKATNKPLSTTLFRIRKDLTWEDVVNNDNSTVIKKPNRKSDKPKKKSTHFRGYWTDIANCRAFFDSFAKENGFDPLVPENWYNVTVSELKAAGGTAIFSNYKSSKQRALCDAYPEVKFDLIRLANNQGRWSESSNVRDFFDDYAKKKNFDPLVPDNWYHVNRLEIVKHNGGSIIYRYNSVYGALSVAFPELQFDSNKFQIRSGGKPSIQNVRQFFLNFAESRKFDPLVPSNWYHVKLRILKSMKGFFRIYSKEDDWINLLIEAFPEVKFDLTQFAERGYWDSVTNVRRFFENFAKDRGFDHRNVENWYLVTKEEVGSTKEGQSLLCHFHGRLKLALMSSFVELPFNENLLASNTITPVSCRQIVDLVAKEKGFDPSNVENWYGITTSDLQAIQGGGSLLVRYGSILQVLRTAYPNLEFDVSRFKKGKEKNQEFITFFQNYARHHNLDPQAPENWPVLRWKEVASFEGGLNILAAAKNSVKTALQIAFPENKINWALYKKRNYWSSVENCRKFLDEFAKSKGFDPVDPENWKKIKKSEVINSRIGGASILAKNSLSNILSLCYPNTGMKSPNKEEMVN